MSTHLVGNVRPTQVLWTYGPGALIDLPNLSVVTMGLDRWDAGQCPPVEEARLLAAVRRILGPQVGHLRVPPFVRDEEASPLSAEGKIGIPVRPFPRWLRCVECGLISDIDLNLFAVKPNPFRPEQTHFVHSGCVGSRGDKRAHDADAVPVRFLLACRNGHLDDFPWHWFVHGGSSACSGTLRFFETGASLQTENLWVKCDECGSARSLVHAFGLEARQNLPACRGRHPHLGTFDPSCEETPRAVLLGATNSWFPVSLSVLAIPLGNNKLDQLVLDGWEYLSDVESADELRIVIRTLSKSGAFSGIERFDPEDVWRCVQERKEGKTDDSGVTERDLKVPEWRVLTAPTPPVDWPQFMSHPEPPPASHIDRIAKVLLLERLREVNALIGYTRVEAPEETDDPSERPPMAALSRGRPEWVPACDVRGEGIFVQFDEEAVRGWEILPSVKERDRRLEAGHREWRRARGLDPGKGYPGIRYAMLHTFAHLVIRELALECGYNAASIRERVYASSDSSSPMAGVIIYTAAADSDGTLGGLVELGRSENLERLVSQALARAAVCSSDPLCSEHDPGHDRSLHIASCHACTFVAETSCERSNRYLDRALLVDTFECRDTAYFGKWHDGNG